MTPSMKQPTLRVLLFVALTGVASCADAVTGPRQPAGARAARDTVPPNPADTADCRHGYTIMYGRVICSEQ